MLMEVFEKRNISVFRFNLDMFNSYHFYWNNDEFKISDPLAACRSEIFGLGKSMSIPIGA